MLFVLIVIIRAFVRNDEYRPYGQVLLSRNAVIIHFSKFSAPNIAFLVFDWLKNSNYEPIFGVLRHMENSAPSLKFFAL